MNETPFFFAGSAGSLFGMLHEPAQPSGKVPFVFCHPFAEEKLWAHRAFVTYARSLTQRGHAVLRFDLSGNGDSEGLLEQTSLTAWMHDLEAAIHEVRRRTGHEHIHLLGLRLGATIASLFAEQSDLVDRLVLWAPIIDGGRYMQEQLRTNLTTQLAAYKEIRRERTDLVAALERGEPVNLDGYELMHGLYRDLSAIALASDAKRHPGSCLIAHIDRRPDKVPAEVQQLATRYTSATLTGIQEEPFWKEILRFYDQAPNLFAETNTWLESADAGTRH